MSISNYASFSLEKAIELGLPLFFCYNSWFWIIVNFPWNVALNPYSLYMTQLVLKWFQVWLLLFLSFLVLMILIGFAHQRHWTVHSFFQIGFELFQILVQQGLWWLLIEFFWSVVQLPSSDKVGNAVLCASKYLAEYKTIYHYCSDKQCRNVLLQWTTVGFISQKCVVTLNIFMSELMNK